MAWWNYEQLFNGLSTADLNGQDDWSGDAEWDVAASVVYEGSKSVECTTTVSKSISRLLTATEAGILFFAIRYSATGGANQEFGFRMWDDAVTPVFIGNFGFRNFAGTAKNFYSYNSDASTVQIQNSALNTWYIYAIQFQASDKTLRVNLYSGGAWQGWGSWVTMGASTSGNIGKIGLVKETDWTGYIDTISPTNYTGSTLLIDTLTANNGTFVLTGNAADIVRVFILTAVSTMYTLTGNAVNILYNSVLSAASAMFTLTGNTVNLAAAFYLSALTQQYTLTGNAINIAVNYVLSLTHGAFSLVGNAIVATFDAVWDNLTKNNTTFTNSNKNSINPSNTSKSNPSWVNEDKSYWTQG